MAGVLPAGMGGGVLMDRFAERRPRIANFARNNSSALLNFGLGMLSGGNRSEAWGNAQQGMAYGAQADQARRQRTQEEEERARREEARNNLLMSPEFQSLSAEDRAWMLANPDAADQFIAADIQRRTTPAEPRAPIEVNGQLVDPVTFEVVGDYRTPEPPDFQERVIPAAELAALNLPALPEGQVWVDTDNGPVARGASAPLVSIDQRQDTALAAGLGGVLATDIFGPMITEGVQAGQDLALVNRLGELLTTTGGGAGAALVQIAGNMGIQLGETADEVQAAQAIINYLTPRQRVPGSGATSDFDARMFSQSLPRLINQPGANELILNTMRGLAQHKVEMGRIATLVATGALTADQALAEIAALPDPFAAFKASPYAPAASVNMRRTPANDPQTFENRFNPPGSDGWVDAGGGIRYRVMP